MDRTTGQMIPHERKTLWRRSSGCQAGNLLSARPSLRPLNSITGPRMVDPEAQTGQYDPGSDGSDGSGNSAVARCQSQAGISRMGEEPEKCKCFASGKHDYVEREEQDQKCPTAPAQVPAHNVNFVTTGRPPRHDDIEAARSAGRLWRCRLFRGGACPDHGRDPPHHRPAQAQIQFKNGHALAMGLQKADHRRYEINQKKQGEQDYQGQQFHGGHSAPACLVRPGCGR